jgi:hypothetical protein
MKSCVIYWNNCRWLFAFIPIIADCITSSSTNCVVFEQGQDRNVSRSRWVTWQHKTNSRQQDGTIDIRERWNFVEFLFDVIAKWMIHYVKSKIKKIIITLTIGLYNLFLEKNKWAQSDSIKNIFNGFRGEGKSIWERNPLKLYSYVATNAIHLWLVIEHKNFLAKNLW